MLTQPFVEQDCTFTKEGRSFTAGGAVVTDDYVIAYLKDHTVTTWHGEVLGAAWVTRTWSVGFGQRMGQIRATINGREYTGRGQGQGMICRLRPTAEQRRKDQQA